MENNSSKQILLSVIGVAILVIAVVGVSFAFFTYSQTGAQDNVITTGSLTFAFNDDDGQFINLTNHFPITTGEGLALSGEDKGICTFTVSGTAPEGTTISYRVYAEDGGTREGTKFPKNEVFIAAEDTGDATVVYGEGVETGTAIENLESGLLASGTIEGTKSNNFTVRMWVDSSVVHVGDDDGNAATHDYSTDDYGKMYYTMKIRVAAEA